MEFTRIVPVLRILSIEKAKEFYIGFLGFKLDWEHRFDEGLPLYMQISRGGVLLHLSEHHGDGCPGAHIRVEMTGLNEFHTELIAKKYGYGRPGIQEQEWGELSMTTYDPFNNRVYFCESLKK